MSRTPIICGVIPAKGTSQRTPAKNRQRVLDVPLFLWAANNLARRLPRDRVFVDSDCLETLTLATQAGFGTIHRPARLATNSTDGNGLMRWAAENISCDILVQHMPTMPFLRKSTLEQAIDQVVSGACDSAIGMVEEPLYLWTEHGPTYDRNHVPNSFTLPLTRIEGMGLYVTHHALVRETGLRFPGQVAAVELSRYEAIDIDTPADLEFARTVARGLDSDSEYLIGLPELGQRLEKCA